MIEVLVLKYYKKFGVCPITEDSSHVETNAFLPRYIQKGNTKWNEKKNYKAIHEHHSISFKDPLGADDDAASTASDDHDDDDSKRSNLFATTQLLEVFYQQPSSYQLVGRRRYNMHGWMIVTLTAAGMSVCFINSLVAPSFLLVFGCSSDLGRNLRRNRVS